MYVSSLLCLLPGGCGDDGAPFSCFWVLMSELAVSWSARFIRAPVFLSRALLHLTNRWVTYVRIRHARRFREHIGNSCWKLQIKTQWNNITIHSRNLGWFVFLPHITGEFIVVFIIRAQYRDRPIWYIGEGPLSGTGVWRQRGEIQLTELAGERREEEEKRCVAIFSYQGQYYFNYI